MIRDAEPGTKVNIHAFYGGAHGKIIGKARRSGHVWYNVEVINGGSSRSEPGSTLECRTHWLSRRHQT